MEVTRGTYLTSCRDNIPARYCPRQMEKHHRGAPTSSHSPKEGRARKKEKNKTKRSGTPYRRQVPWFLPCSLCAQVMYPLLPRLYPQPNLSFIEYSYLPDPRRGRYVPCPPQDGPGRFAHWDLRWWWTWTGHDNTGHWTDRPSRRHDPSEHPFPCPGLFPIHVQGKARQGRAGKGKAGHGSPGQGPVMSRALSNASLFQCNVQSNACLCRPAFHPHYMLAALHCTALHPLHTLPASTVQVSP